MAVSHKLCLTKLLNPTHDVNETIVSYDRRYQEIKCQVRN